MTERLAILACGLAAAASLATASLRASTQDRYIASVEPVNVGLPQNICVAAAPRSPDGIWWWEPGALGCKSRSTGPDVFHAEQAKITRASADRLVLTFRIPTHSTTRPFVDVRLVVENGAMRSGESGPAVPVSSRANLQMPESPPRGGRGQPLPGPTCVYRESGFRSGVNPPRQVSRVEPDFAGTTPPPPDQIFVVEVRIDDTGRVTEDCMLRGAVPDADRRVLDAVRAWRFEPPRLTKAVDWQGGHWDAGTPVPIFMTLSVQLKPRS
jgi:hypothetical protein